MYCFLLQKWFSHYFDFNISYFQTFLLIQLEIDGFGVLEAEYYMEIALEWLSSAPGNIGNWSGIVFERKSTFFWAMCSISNSYSVKNGILKWYLNIY